LVCNSRESRAPESLIAGFSSDFKKGPRDPGCAVGISRQRLRSFDCRRPRYPYGHAARRFHKTIGASCSRRKRLRRSRAMVQAKQSRDASCGASDDVKTLIAVNQLGKVTDQSFGLVKQGAVV